MESHAEEFAQLESLDNEKPVGVARVADVPLAMDLFRYMAGWATKIEGNTIPISVLYTPGTQYRLTPPRAGGCGGSHHPLERSATDGSVEARTRPGCELHCGLEAGRADTKKIKVGPGLDSTT
jgi:hypothetical protein